MKALRKEIPERYASVEQLSEDLVATSMGSPSLARAGDLDLPAGKADAPPEGRHRGPALVLASLTAGRPCVSIREAQPTHDAGRPRQRAEAVRRGAAAGQLHALRGRSEDREPGGRDRGEGAHRPAGAGVPRRPGHRGRRRPRPDAGAGDRLHQDRATIQGTRARAQPRPARAMRWPATRRPNASWRSWSPPGTTTSRPGGPSPVRSMARPQPAA